MKEKFISLGGLIVSIAIIMFALTYEIETDTKSEAVKSVNENTATNLNK